MPRFVALLRGVNVGGRKRVPMSEFSALLTALGCTDVRTLLNSGNAVFSSPTRSAGKLAAALAGAIERRLQVSTQTCVKTSAEFAAIIRGNPLEVPDSDHSRFLVAFAQDRHTLQSIATLQPLAGPNEGFAVTRDAAYLHCPEGLLTSRLSEAMLGKPGRALTTRNWATVLKLEALLRQPA